MCLAGMYIATERNVQPKAKVSHIFGSSKLLRCAKSNGLPQIRINLQDRTHLTKCREVSAMNSRVPNDVHTVHL